MSTAGYRGEGGGLSRGAADVRRKEEVVMEEGVEAAVQELLCASATLAALQRRFCFWWGLKSTFCVCVCVCWPRLASTLSPETVALTSVCICPVPPPPCASRMLAFSQRSRECCGGCLTPLIIDGSHQLGPGRPEEAPPGRGRPGWSDQVGPGHVPAPGSHSTQLFR